MWRCLQDPGDGCQLPLLFVFLFGVPGLSSDARLDGIDEFGGLWQVLFGLDPWRFSTSVVPRAQCWWQAVKAGVELALGGVG